MFVSRKRINNSFIRKTIKINKMKFGYARISTSDQKLDMQIDSLLRAGVDHKNIFTDISSGVKTSRPGFDKMISILRKDDEVVIWRLDRLARNLSHLLKVVEGWNHDGIILKSLQEPMVDPTTSTGKMFIQMVGMMAELERNSLIERTNAGLSAAKKRGRTGGRPKGMSKEAKRKAKLCKGMYLGGSTVRDIIEGVGISRATIYKYLRHEGVEPDGLEERQKYNYTEK